MHLNSAELIPDRGLIPPEQPCAVPIRQRVRVLVAGAHDTAERRDQVALVPARGK